MGSSGIWTQDLLTLKGKLLYTPRPTNHRKINNKQSSAAKVIRQMTLDNDEKYIKGQEKFMCYHLNFELLVEPPSCPDK